MPTPVAREHQEELLELCWTAAEDRLTPLDRDRLPDQLLCYLPHPIEPDGDRRQDTIDALIRDGRLLAEGRRIQLSPSGAQAAQAIVRRHRLTEVLLHNVLAVSEETMESTACQVEHILNPEATDAVCHFLGHPPECPHGRAIPQDLCCRDSTARVAPLIVPLDQLGLGEAGIVAFIRTARHEYLQRLSAFGVAAGARVRLRQSRPSIVIQIGETELALDTQAGRELYVQRLP